MNTRGETSTVPYGMARSLSWATSTTPTAFYQSGQYYSTHPATRLNEFRKSASTSKLYPFSRVGDNGHSSTEPIYESSREGVYLISVEASKEVRSESKPATRCDWLSQDLAILEELSKLPKDWNSYNAEPPNSIALNEAKLVLRILFRMGFAPTCVTPSAEDGVAICFVQGAKYADVECFNNGEVLAVISDGRGDPDVWELSDPKEVESALERISVFIRD